MKIITDADISKLGITPAQCVDWVRESFMMKGQADLPPKIMQHMPGDVFFNTMPCYLPSVGRFSVKVISRHPGRTPALKSKILLYDVSTGEMIALMDGNWITAMRTGAVATLAAQVFANCYETAAFAFVGLGEMARATMKCLVSTRKTIPDVWLMAYKDHASRFIEEFKGLANFHVTLSRRELVENTQVLFSCVTKMDEQFLPPSAYPDGYLCVPVHTRGFQDCDLVFDKVFADDTGHVHDFKNFSRFKTYAEMTEVLDGSKSGRTSSHERILSYNIGLGLHDLVFSNHVERMI